MAASGYTPISLYYSSTAGHIPVNTNLVNGELAINIADGKLFYKDSGGTVQVLAGAGGTGVVAGSNTQVQFNNNGVFGASSAFTWNGTTLAATKVAGQLDGALGSNTPAAATVTSLTDSGLTATRVTFAGVGGLLADNSAFTFDGSYLTVPGLKDSALTSTRVVYAGSSGSLVDSAALTFDGTNLGIANINGATSLTLKTGGTAAVTVSSTQKVGIGTATPLSTLHVVGGNSNNAIIDNNGQQYTTLSWYNNGVEKAQTYWDQTNGLFVTGTDVSAATVFKTNGTERMRIAGSSGNVSIGTASTPIKFLVNGTDAIGLPVGTTAQQPTGAAGYMRFNTDTNKFEGHNGSTWTNVGSGATGGGSNAVFYLNDQTVTESYTIPAATNAMTAGPISIDPGATVTITPGSYWVVVGGGA